MRTAEQLVSLEEIATATRRKASEVAADLAELGVSTFEDWTGRPSVRVRDARGLVDGSTRQARENRRAWEAHKAACEAWLLARKQAVVDAAEAAEAALHRAQPGRHRDHPGKKTYPIHQDPRGYPSEELQEVRGRASSAAGVAFEKSHPRPVLHGKKASGNGMALRFITEAEAPSGKPGPVAAARARLGNGRRPPVTVQ